MMLALSTGRRPPVDNLINARPRHLQDAIGREATAKGKTRLVEFLAIT